MASDFTTKIEDDLNNVTVMAKSEQVSRDYDDDDSYNVEENDMCSLGGRDIDSPSSHPDSIALPSFVQTHLSAELLSETSSDQVICTSYTNSPLLIDDEHRVIQWLREVLTEDPHGRLHVKDLSEMAAGQFGTRKRHLGTWLRKAFPSVYVRRSDRLRWYCGVSVKSEKAEMSQTELAIKEWKDKAVHWLRTSLDINPSYKEKWSDIHRALNTYVGQSPSTEVAITAFKMAFPSIPRRVYDRTAFYVGIRFLDSALIHQTDEGVPESTKPCPITNVYTPQFNFDKVIIAWLQKALIPDKEKCERTKTVMNLLKRKFFPELNKKHFLRILRKGFPAIEYYRRDREGLLHGVKMDDNFVEGHFPSWKVISWIKDKILRPCNSGSVRASQLTPILQSKLGINNALNAIRLAQVAYPDAQYRQWSEGGVICGVELKDNCKDTLPLDIDTIDYFDDSDNEEHFESEDGNISPCFSTKHILPAQKTHISLEPTYRPSKRPRFTSLERPAPPPEPIKDTTMPEKDGKCNLLGPCSESKLKTIDDKVTSLGFQIAELRNEFKALRDDLTKTVGQKDALIAQLQQTLVMLCQQQLKGSTQPNCDGNIEKPRDTH